uniref:Uncharacterized protein n=1 Tax=Chromera velia CCMP2878 TaxID=1169474 RepID=A0A0G4ICY9_9ALVE|eukprot:Cvel_97.t1-p1 / transcript=Cvel_97.t1 / gene=Cvel_97 / organism=Chromera_velia_CCMP2878 / gene_product=hypothetical protein / transcript_product=hypothetical protein / location=Cvel_scaffold8:53186-54780(+) / protein_length=349 / sequence_SO=supercontig / SO=protein_coding / is_pseudo=false
MEMKNKKAKRSAVPRNRVQPSKETLNPFNAETCEDSSKETGRDTKIELRVEKQNRPAWPRWAIPGGFIVVVLVGVILPYFFVRPPGIKVQSIWERADTALDEERLEEAEDLYREVLKVVSNDSVVWTNLGTVQILRGDLRNAVESLRTAVRGEPANQPESWHNLGTALRQLGEHREAVSAFQKAVHFSPSMRNALDSLLALSESLRVFPELLLHAISAHRATLSALYETQNVPVEGAVVPEGVDWAVSQVASVRLGLAELLLKFAEGEREVPEKGEGKKWETGSESASEREEEMPCQRETGECERLAVLQIREIERIGKFPGGVEEDDAELDRFVEQARLLAASLEKPN